MNNQTVSLPLWKNALEKMREEGIEYLKAYPVKFFEDFFRCAFGDPKFAFEMMALRHELEADDGYYMRSENNGTSYVICAAAEHEDVAHRFDTKVRRFAVRSINLRSATLMNPKAELTAGERALMEKNLEKAAIRLALMSRQKSISELVREHKPKLLDKSAKAGADKH